MTPPLVALLIALLLAAPSRVSASDPPRLVVQITVDQLRGDLPLRYRDRFGPGGFRYLLERGTWYAAAHHPHAHTETIVGHTTLATGTYPSRHGMVANTWFDRETGKSVSNVEDPRYPLLSVLGEAQSGPGASPLTIPTTTFSDELAITTAGRAKIYAVSVKDRGAVPLAGHTGKAFWFSLSNGCFVSSTFYYQQYPPWVKAKCGQRLADGHANTTWELSGDRAAYLARDHTNRYPPGSPAEANMAMLDSPGLGFGRTFPHRFAASGRTLYDGLTISPRGDELTLDFAKTLIAEEGLGKDEVPDYLAISFSSTDLVGHWFSPASLESEETILRLDAALRDLFAFIDREVGLDKTLIVLAGDHGGPEYPEYLQERNIDSGRLSPADIRRAAEDALAARYRGIKGLLAHVSPPYLYLDHGVIARKGLDRAAVERVVASAVQRVPGVALAIGRGDLTDGRGGVDEALIRRIRRNDYPGRSGDVYVVQRPQWQIDEPRSPKLVQHGSPWAYDTYVPVAFAGGQVPAAFVLRSIETVDVAATLAVLLRTKPPSGSVGTPLTELSPLTPPGTTRATP